MVCFAMPDELFFRQRQVDIPITFSAVPDSFLCRRLQAVPSLRTFEQEVAIDSGFFVPVHDPSQCAAL